MGLSVNTNILQNTVSNPAKQKYETKIKPSSIFSDGEYSSLTEQTVCKINRSDEDCRYLAEHAVQEHNREENKKTVYGKVVEFFTGNSNEKTLIAKDFSQEEKAIMDEIVLKTAQALQAQGSSLKDYDEDEQINITKITFKHVTGGMSNDEYLLQIKDFTKKRLSRIVKENSGWKKFLGFLGLMKNFKEAVDESTKLNIATVSASSKMLPEESAHALLLLYSNTIPERRKEIITEALKYLPDNISKEEILKFAISSENMSVLEINFAKDYIIASDLPEAIKQEKLKMLEYFATKEALRAVTISIARMVFEYKNIHFDAAMAKIDKKDKMIKTIKTNKKELSKEQDDMLLKREKYKDKIYVQKNKLKQIIAELTNTHFANNKIMKKFEQEQDELKKLVKLLNYTNSDLKTNEQNLSVQNFHESICLSQKNNAIKASGFV